MKKILKTVFLVLVVTVCGVLLSGCNVSKEKITEYERVVSEGHLFLDGKEYNLALEKFSTASEVIPERKDAFEGIVDIFILKNRLEDAVKILDESAAKLGDKDRAVLYSRIADAYYETNNFSKALTTYQLAKGFDTSNSNALLGIAKSSVQKGNVESARKILKNDFDGDLNIEAKLLLSYIEGLGDIEMALSTVNSLQPNDFWRDRYTAWKEALESIDEDKMFNSVKISKVYIDEKYPYLAIALLEPLKLDITEYDDGMYMLGKAYYEYGEYEKSIELLENSVSLSDLNQYIYWVLARDYYLLDNLESSLSYYDTAISYGADEAVQDMYIEYIGLLIDEKQTEKALEVLGRADRIFEEDWVPLLYMQLYSLRKDHDKYDYYAKQVELEELEENSKLQYLYIHSKYLIENNELEDVQRFLDLFWDLDQYDARYNYLVAKLSFEKGDLEESRKYVYKAIEYDTRRVITDDAQKLLAQID